jgi:uncharacterized metal-binding protein YceD (DUF177 family)
MKKRTLNELRQVKEYQHPVEQDDTVEFINELYSRTVEKDIADKIKIIKQKLYVKLDLEGLIRDEMIKEGLSFDQYHEDDEDKIYVAFHELLQFVKHEITLCWEY